MCYPPVLSGNWLKLLLNGGLLLPCTRERRGVVSFLKLLTDDFCFPTTNSIFPYLYTGNLYVLNCQSDGMTWAFITKIHYPSWVMVAPSTPRVIIRRRVATPLNPTPETTQKNLGIQYFQACSPTPGLRVPFFFFFFPLQALTLPYEVCWGCELSRLCSSAIFPIKF